ncbi:ShlB/FhaC/HecB family hemolysin secretion/activation protein [Salinicola endophyticus]|uniref:ShlB/FhaC/HecB family hemolysin secretion/activation protein n=1 Tax=Salinicola endophyticus TaxID=1949083 RepID=A0ABY8FLM0_9GAMM|nr:ShlB/FhaC/HecB family hemolysin secretion/activation protein [Salinicola endophyticus]
MKISPEPETRAPEQATPCFLIENFEWYDAHHLSSARRRALTHPLKGKCLSLSQMQALAHSASNAYIEQGYVTSLVHLPEQDVSGGTLRPQAEEGRIESITLDGQQSRGLKMIFPHAKGSVLNLRALEQGMVCLRRTQGARSSEHSENLNYRCLGYCRNCSGRGRAWQAWD